MPISNNILKGQLDAMGVEYPADAKNADLVKLVKDNTPKVEVAEGDDVVVNEDNAPAEETTEPEVVVKGKWPVVVGNGKFQAVAFKDGFVIYNASGTRVSGVETEERAKDVVMQSNYGAGLK